MVSLYDIYKTDPEKEEKGVPVKMGDATIFIASSSGTGNKRLAKKQAEYAKDVTNKKISGVVDPYDRMKDLYAECVVVGWEGVTDENGKELPYSKENVRKLFDDLPHFLDEVITYASNIQNFKTQVIDDIVKN